MLGLFNKDLAKALAEESLSIKALRLIWSQNFERTYEKYFNSIGRTAHVSGGSI